MISGGDASEQVVRMSLEAGEVALKITGAGAKQLAVMLYAILKDQKKTRGRVRMESLIRSGRPLTVFSVKESDLKQFVQSAKKYGVLYCAVRNSAGTSDGMVDVMVKEEDAVRINRIVERFKFASVTETASLKAEIEQSKEKKQATVPGNDIPEINTEQLLDELFQKPVPKEERQTNPSLAKIEKSRLSEPILEKPNKTEEGIIKQPEKPSVKKDLEQIRAEWKLKKSMEATKDNVRSKTQRHATQPKQPKSKRKVKSKER